jgi:hypothetical protein
MTAGDQAAAATTGGTWGNARALDGAGSLSCGAPGDCVSVNGSVVVEETNGVWGSGFALDGAAFATVTCVSAGNCVVGGAVAGQAVVAAEQDGTWGSPVAVPGVKSLNSGAAAEVKSVSCSSAGDCAAGGYYTDVSGHKQAFVADEISDVWGTGQEVPGTASLNVYILAAAEVNSVSCSSAGNCAAGGYYMDSSGVEQAFVAAEQAGKWAIAEKARPASLSLSEGGYATSVSCPTNGHCSAGVYYVPTGSFITDDVDGTWGTPEQIGPGGAYLPSISCPAEDNCVAGGGAVGGSTQAFIATGGDGSWTSQQVPGLATLDLGLSSEVFSVSCPSAGNCAAAGLYDGPDAQQPFVADEINGTWGNAQEVPGILTLDGGDSASATSVSCAAPGDCALSGTFWSGPNSGDKDSSYVDDEGWAQPTSTAETVSAQNVTYGAEQDARVTATVTSSSSWTPGGAVTISSGNQAVCTITLTAGSGSCAVPATALPPGAGQLTASYNGNRYFTASQASPASLSIGRASTSTALRLSGAAVSYGGEQAELLSVSVPPQYSGTPAGTVTVHSGTNEVCAITLASGSGSCPLTEDQFLPGSVPLTATYGGSADFTASTSADAQLTVHDPTTTRLALSAAKIPYRHEQAEKMTVTVAQGYGALPEGNVSLKSKTGTLCEITLSAGKGTCTLRATQIAAGSSQITATYPGDASLTASSSSVQKLTVTKETTKTALFESTAKMTYGHEQAERLTVSVVPEYGGIPTGKVTIKAGNATVCVITLASGKGSCTLTQRALHVGTYKLLASYAGSSNLAASASVEKTLTVIK